MNSLLAIKDLHVQFETHAGIVQAVRGVNLHIQPGETVAVVGESGCGKSITAQTILKLHTGKIVKGEVFFEGQDLLKITPKQMEKTRGKEVGMIFQDPMTSLNPTMKVGAQIMEGAIKHRGLSKKEARSVALEMLRLVGIPQPEERIDQYPHQFSGGMRQRVMIAIALVCRPKLIIADEPTTALDVTIQAQILALLKSLQKQFGMSILIITHNLGVVAGLCDRVVVMYAGQVMEEGPVEQIFSTPKHPYTQALLKAVPRLGMKKSEPLVPIIGSPPNLLTPPPGCPFAPRCPQVMTICHEQQPPFDPTHSACWLHVRTK